MLQPNKTIVKQKIDNTDSEMFDNLITMDQLLKRLNGKFSRQTIYNYNCKGLPSVKIGGKLLYSFSDVVSWLLRRRKQ